MNKQKFLTSHFSSFISKNFSLLIFHFSTPKGQSLITLLFFTVIGTTIITASIIMMYVNMQSGTKLQQGIVAHQIAESGAENALLRLLRNPNYTGETLTIGSGSALIEKSGSGTAANPYILTSTGTLGNFIKKIRVTAKYENNLLTILSKQEVF